MTKLDLPLTILSGLIAFCLLNAGKMLGLAVAINPVNVLLMSGLIVALMSKQRIIVIRTAVAALVFLMMMLSGQFFNILLGLAL